MARIGPLPSDNEFADAISEIWDLLIAAAANSSEAAAVLRTFEDWAFDWLAERRCS